MSSFLKYYFLACIIRTNVRIHALDSTKSTQKIYFLCCCNFLSTTVWCLYCSHGRPVKSAKELSWYTQKTACRDSSRNHTYILIATTIAWSYLFLWCLREHCSMLYYHFMYENHNLIAWIGAWWERAEHIVIIRWKVFFCEQGRGF